MPTQTILYAGILLMIIIPTLSALILKLFSSLFKFSKTDYRSALYCTLIIFASTIAVQLISSIILGDNVSEEIGVVLLIVILAVGLGVGTYMIQKIYKTSILKSFFASLLTGIITYALIGGLLVLLMAQYFI